MKTSKKLLWMLLCIILFSCMVLIGTGCSLAKEDINPGEDRLCGVVLTIDTTLMDGQQLWEGSSDESKQPKLYATKVEGETDTTYRFDRFKNSSLYSFQVKDPHGEYESCFSTGDIQGVTVHYNMKDEGEEVELTGTIKLVNRTEVMVYMYPVYQSSNGELYILPFEGSGVSVSGNALGTMSRTIEEASTKTVDGVVRSSSTKVIVTVESVPELQFVTVKEMNEEDLVIAKHEIHKEEFTDDNSELKLITKEDTEYLLVEEYYVTYEGKEEVVRTVYDASKSLENEEPLTLLCQFSNNNGIVVPKSVEIVK